MMPGGWLDRVFVVSIFASSVITYMVPLRRSMVRSDDGRGPLNADGRLWVGLICAMPFVWIGLLWLQANHYAPLDLGFVGVPVLAGRTGH